MVDIFEKQEDPLVEIEEIMKVIKNCFFYQRDIRKLSDINKMFISNFVKNGRIQKNVLLELLRENDEIQEIFHRNFNNTEDIDNFFDEEIWIICNNNLKKSKLTNFEDFNHCENIVYRLEKILSIIDKVYFFIFL